MNSLLQQLEEEFGVRDITPKTFVYTSRKHEWTLRKLDWIDLEKATSMLSTLRPPDPPGDGKSAQPPSPEDVVEAEILGSLAAVSLRYQLAFACNFIVAIDGKPTWEIFEIATVADLAGADPLAPPKVVRARTANALHKFLSNSKKIGLVTELWDVYTKHLDENAAKPKEDTAVAGESPDRPI